MHARPLVLVAMMIAAPAPAGAGSVRPSGSAGLAAGVDDNLNAAVERTERVGSAYGQLTGGVALATGPFRRVGTVGLRYRGRTYLQLPDLTSHAVDLSAGLYLSPKRWLEVSVSPSAGGRWVTDEARRSLVGDVAAAVRWRPVRVVSFAAGYGLSHRIAMDPVFSGTAHSAHGGLELRFAKRTWLAAEYGFSAGPIVRYDTVLVPLADSPDTGDGDGKKPPKQPKEPVQSPSDVFGEAQVATRIPSLAHSVVLDFEQGLSKHVYLRAYAGMAFLVADDELSTARFAQVTVGIRLR